MQTPISNEINKATNFIIYFIAIIIVIIQTKFLYEIATSHNFNFIFTIIILIFLAVLGIPTIVKFLNINKNVIFEYFKPFFYIYLRCKYNPIKIKELTPEIIVWLDNKSFWWLYDNETLWLKNKQKAMEFKLTWGGNL